jgi:hypothetical protein
MRTSTFCAFACFASVPNTSSASNPGSSNVGDAERLDYLADPRDLAAQLVRHRRARRLVRLGLLVPERPARRVQRDRQVRGLQLVEDGEQRAREAVDARHYLAGAADGELDRLAGLAPLEHQERAVDQAVAVDQYERGFGARHEGSI